MTSSGRTWARSSPRGAASSPRSRATTSAAIASPRRRRRCTAHRPGTRAGIAFHWRIQPVIHIASDGRSANLRTRLFHPDTGKQAVRAGRARRRRDHVRHVSERSDGARERYLATVDAWRSTSSSFHDGGLESWLVRREAEAARIAPPAAEPAGREDGARHSDDRARAVARKHFRGGTGETIEWPGILPMWFNYRNPVSGRVPERYWPDCAPGELKPDSQMTEAAGYRRRRGPRGNSCWAPPFRLRCERPEVR